MRQLKLLFLVLTLRIAAFAMESPFSGTWKLNPAKSKLQTPAPQSNIATVDDEDNGLRVSEDITYESVQVDLCSYSGDGLLICRTRNLFVGQAA